MSNYNGTPLEAKQMSIYDFLAEPLAKQVEKSILQDGESQEVQPSETVPQVDEAQEIITIFPDSPYEEEVIIPSSALDAKKQNTLSKESYDAILIECDNAFDTVEVTDKALISAEPKFEVNQVVTVLNPYSEIHEDFHILEQYKSQERRVVGISFYKGKTIYETVLPHTQDSPHYFYEHELK
ncbi:TPA: hypothetical protein ACGXMV_004153 [Bacillus pacificus]